MECQGIINEQRRVACFEKVGYELFKTAVVGIRPSLLMYGDKDISSPSESLTCLMDLKLPTRGTAMSAGYDFHAPFGFTLESGGSLAVPTGICCKIAAGWGLFVFPRSGLGFKYKVSLANTVGIIDGDYYNADNNQIVLKLVNNSDKALTVQKGDKFAQGVFLPYGLTIDDNCSAERTGGFGSTGR